MAFNHDASFVRNQDLSGIGCGTDAPGTIHVGTNIIMVHEEWFAGMESHTDQQLNAIRPAFVSQRMLGFDGSGDRFCSSRENGAERIGLCAYFMALPFLKSGAQDALVLFQNMSIINFQPLNELG